MSNKPYKLGIVVGRFQSFHTGHENMINTAVMMCDKVLLLVGSSQESGTMKNPFTYEERKRILHKIFGDQIHIYPLPDIGAGNNNKWGRYVFNNVKKYLNQSPDLLVSGKEQRRLDWFDNVDDLSIAELYIPKKIDITATRMREHLLNDEFEKWKTYTNKKIWDEYDNFRKTVYLCKDNTYTESI